MSTATKIAKAIIRRSISCINATLAPIAKTVSPSSKIIGPPKGFYSSAQDFVQNSPSNEQFRFTEISKNETGIPVKQLPGTIDDFIHQQFLENKTYDVPARFVLEIKRGRVTDPNCYIITPDDKLIGGLSREFRINDQFHRMSIFRSLKLPVVKKISGNIGVVGYPGGSYNYFHWMFDVLPRIGILEKSGFLGHCDRIVINPFKFPFQKDTIKRFDLPWEKFIFSDGDLHIEADNLIVPSIPEQADRIPRWSIDYLREKFSYNFEKYAGAGRHIFISRRNAANRRLVNEDDVEMLLQQYGFTIYSLEELGHAAQAGTFHHADCIVAPHGASQSNLIFCRPGTRIIELFAPDWVNSCYWTMSNTLDLQYFYLIGDPVQNAANKNNVGTNIYIDVHKLEQTLQLAGIKRLTVQSNL